MKMRTAILSVIVALVGLPSAVLAQDTYSTGEGKTKLSGGIFAFQFGYGDHEVGSLNESLSGVGLPTVEDGFWEMSGKFNLFVRNFVIGGEGTSLLNKTSENGNGMLRYEAKMNQFKLGYVVLGKRGFELHPEIGVGRYKQTVFLRNDSLPGDFSGTLTSGGTASELTRNGLMLSGEVVANWMPGFDETSGGGIVIGLVAGYRYAATAGGWELWEEPVAGGPDPSLTGWYVRLSLGVGGMARQ